MTAKIIDGSSMARALFEEVRQGVEEGFPGRKPGLVSLAVGGDDPPSKVYAASQRKAANRVGIDFKRIVLPADVSEREVLAVLSDLNRDREVDGIILQRPLPGHLEAGWLISAIWPEKDVEGTHPLNLGAIVQGKPGFVPCTAEAAVRLFKSIGLPPRGLEVVVVGHSEIAGKPIALLLVHELATITLCHIGTRDLESHTRRADVLFVATGVPGLIRGSGVKPGACVIDIGINRIEAMEDGKKVSRIVGDVAFAEVAAKAGFITPVPGGVGPVTTAILMENTLKAARALL